MANQEKTEEKTVKGDEKAPGKFNIMLTRAKSKLDSFDENNEAHKNVDVQEFMDYVRKSEGIANRSKINKSDNKEITGTDPDVGMNSGAQPEEKTAPKAEEKDIIDNIVDTFGMFKDSIAKNLGLAEETKPEPPVVKKDSKAQSKSSKKSKQGPKISKESKPDPENIKETNLQPFTASNGKPISQSMLPAGLFSSTAIPVVSRLSENDLDEVRGSQAAPEKNQLQESPAKDKS